MGREESVTLGSNRDPEVRGQQEQRIETPRELELQKVPEVPGMAMRLSQLTDREGNQSHPSWVESLDSCSKQAPTLWLW